MRRFVVVKVRRTKAGEARIRERIAANKCVSCETTTEKANAPDGAAQRCEKCRSRHRRLKASLTPAKQNEFDKRLAAVGRLLFAHELPFFKAEDTTQKIFEEVAK